MAVWSVPKLGTEMMEIWDPFWTVHGLLVWLVLNCGFGCCEAGNGHRFQFQGSTTDVHVLFA